MAKIKPITLTKRLKPQAAIVLDYLTTHRDLTNLIASGTLGVTSITSRISELRDAGVPIIRTWHRDHLGKRYAKYRLED